MNLTALRRILVAGKGTCVYKNGGVYDGDWASGVRHVRRPHTVAPHSICKLKLKLHQPTAPDTRLPSVFSFRPLTLPCAGCRATESSR